MGAQDIIYQLFPDVYGGACEPDIGVRINGGADGSDQTPSIWGAGLLNGLAAMLRTGLALVVRVKNRCQRKDR